MFRMTITDARGTPLAEGPSRDGECWRETFVRLYNGRPSGASPRRAIVRCRPPTPAAGPAGRWATVVPSHRPDPSDGAEVDDPPVFVRTEPDQF